jgi:myxalamid-type polyketide synthase MxaE and MxaD
LPYQINDCSLKPALALSSEATYLVTGGFGGLGLNTAKWLAKCGARHLVLMGRSAPSLDAVCIVEQLQGQGVSVLKAEADVAEWNQLANVMAQIKKSMPPLRGIFHAAGMLDDGAISNLDAERMRRVLRSKVQGTWNLHRATMKCSLDFCVFFSSAVSVLGAPGQANYAAASAFLDSMAHLRNSLSLPALTINWGPWAEVGLAAEVSEKLASAQKSNQHLVKVIGIDQGFQVLEQLLQQPINQVMALPFDLANLLQLYPTAAALPFLSEVGEREKSYSRLYARPRLHQQYLAPRNEMEHKLVALWRQTLHIEQVGVRDSFFELGGDSVLAAQVLSLTQKTFGISIQSKDVFKEFTIERLAEKLEEAIITKINAMSEEEAQEALTK